MRTPEFLSLVEKYIDCAPTEVAIRSGNSELATTIKYLQRARTKLPTYFKHRCIIDGQLFEQCSSEVTASAKFDGITGDLAVDLTCGLGVDSLALSPRFNKIISIEIDQKKATTAIDNFASMAVNNIEVRCSSAEDFLDVMLGDGLRADLIFIDPSRVKGGAKVYSLEDSSPNVVNLLPKLKVLAKRVMIKLSPLFDVEECFRIFGNESKVSVVSSDRECKEVLVDISSGVIATEDKSIEHIVIVRNEVRLYSVPYHQHSKYQRLEKLDDAHYIYTPDVAFYKARTVENYIAQIANNISIHFENYIFSKDRLPDSFEGVGYQIKEIIQYKPKIFKSLGINRAILHLKTFPYSLEKVKGELKVKEGGTGVHLFFTTVDSRAVIVIASPLSP